MTTTIITRSDYMQGKATHSEFYGQFVTPAVRSCVAWRIGTERIKSSKDEHFNDIPLRLWDDIEPMMRNLCLTRMGDAFGIPREGAARRIPWSLNDSVCIAKAAARQIRDGA